MLCLDSPQIARTIQTAAELTSYFQTTQHECFSRTCVCRSNSRCTARHLLTCPATVALCWTIANSNTHDQTASARSNSRLASCSPCGFLQRCCDSITRFAVTNTCLDHPGGRPRTPAAVTHPICIRYGLNSWIRTSCGETFCDVWLAAPQFRYHIVVRNQPRWCMRLKKLQSGQNHNEIKINQRKWMKSCRFMYMPTYPLGYMYKFDLRGLCSAGLPTLAAYVLTTLVDAYHHARKGSLNSVGDRCGEICRCLPCGLGVPRISTSSATCFST